MEHVSLPYIGLDLVSFNDIQYFDVPLKKDCPPDVALRNVPRDLTLEIYLSENIGPLKVQVENLPEDLNQPNVSIWRFNVVD